MLQTIEVEIDASPIKIFFMRGDMECILCVTPGGAQQQAAGIQVLLPPLIHDLLRNGGSAA